jgi:hypothetical protein
MKQTAFRLLADLGDLDVLRPTVGGAAKSARTALSDVVLLVGALLAITLLLMLAVALWMKARRHRHHHHHHHRSSPGPAPVEAVSHVEEDEDEEPGHDHRHRRRRKRRRDHRQLNPTLAETGGLPPIREGPPPSA